MKIFISLLQSVFFSYLFISSSTLASDRDVERPSAFIKNLRYNETCLGNDIISSIEGTLKELSEIELGNKLMKI